MGSKFNNLSDVIGNEEEFIREAESEYFRNTDSYIYNPSYPKIDHIAKDEFDLINFCKSNSLNDMSICDYSYDYQGRNFVFSYSKEVEDVLFYGNYFFKMINEDQGLFMLLDSKLCNFDDRSDPETSITTYFQPKTPSKISIIAFHSSFKDEFLQEIFGGDFPRYHISQK